MAPEVFLPRVYPSHMAGAEEVWLPLVDEPVGDIVAQIQAEDPEIERLVGSPHRILAFRTFAYIRVGILLGSWLIDRDLVTSPRAFAQSTWRHVLFGALLGRFG